MKTKNSSDAENESTDSDSDSEDSDYEMKQVDDAEDDAMKKSNTGFEVVPQNRTFLGFFMEQNGCSWNIIAHAIPIFPFLPPVLLNVV
jgi:hypothetical protein